MTVSFSLFEDVGEVVVTLGVDEVFGAVVVVGVLSFPGAGTGSPPLPFFGAVVVVVAVAVFLATIDSLESETIETSPAALTACTVTVNWEVVSPFVSKLVAVVVGSLGSPNFSPFFHN